MAKRFVEFCSRFVEGDDSDVRKHIFRESYRRSVLKRRKHIRVSHINRQAKCFPSLVNSDEHLLNSKYAEIQLSFLSFHKNLLKLSEAFESLPYFQDKNTYSYFFMRIPNSAYGLVLPCPPPPS